jgi:uncharacterized membrane protein
VEAYAFVKTLHILSATVLFGTGLGIAFFFWMGGRSGNDEAAYFAARATVVADVLFTTTTVIAQPLTGAWLVWRGGFDPLDHWLIVTYLLYLLAGVCWIPVVLIQIRIRNLLRAQLAGSGYDDAQYRRLRAWWVALGWPAFIALLIVVHLMVTKPS